MNPPTLLDMQNIMTIARQAGKIIMQFYNNDYLVNYKENQSPVTEADLASHRFICNELYKYYPNVQILSEETADNFKLDFENIPFWAVDPLDGTKEFINKNDEFTVNIALIKNQLPILGVICLPVQNVVYAAVKGHGAFKQKNNNKMKAIKNNSKKRDNIVFAVSRSHFDKKTREMIAKHKGEILSAGSALKLAYVAEGLVDIYPRFGSTMLWDIAAGQCIVEEAGGKVICANNRQPMTYNIFQMKNKPFIAMNVLWQKKEIL